MSNAVDPADDRPTHPPCARGSAPQPARHGFGARVWILIILIVGAIVLMVSGQNPSAVTTLLVVGFASAEIASRLLGYVPRHPGV